MKNLYFKYILMGLWLICYVPFKKSLVLSSQSDTVAINAISNESTLRESTWAEIAPESNSPSPIQAAYQQQLHLRQFSESPINHLDSWNLRIKNLQGADSFSEVSRSYLNTNYLLWLSGQKDQYFHLQVFSHF
jgi:hypothetical protein